MASSGPFDVTQTYDSYKEFEVLDPACIEFLAKGEDCFKRYNPRFSKCHHCFIGKKPCCHTGKQASNPSEKRFQSQIIPSTPRNFQPILATIPTSIPPASPHSSHTRPALNPAVRPSPIQWPRNSPIVTSQQLQPVASTSRRREELCPLPFPAAQVFQPRDQWPIQVTREDLNTASENQDSVARLFRRVDRYSREVIMYANDRTIPGTASEEMAAKSAWYEDELMNDFQKAFDHLGRDN
ncbi:hypothetical protein O181_082918 [Austropuccinia psidii MF-1]|uniref:Uncharacterized protein n=1 Tax=Austropuccinia psidii MF-1 TaxID=1389203 RepID=A0A9Q3IJ22_9BASI|nr:hypothetical protein [Austropuccinia psidii MF-1]